MSRRPKKPRGIVVAARRWFERTNGNTYHSVAVYVDGKCAGSVPFAYGYGRQYESTAEEVLRSRGYLHDQERREGRPNEALWAYCQRVGIGYAEDVVDVRRRKDLHGEGRG